MAFQVTLRRGALLDFIPDHVVQNKYVVSYQDRLVKNFSAVTGDLENSGWRG